MGMGNPSPETEGTSVKFAESVMLCVRDPQKETERPECLWPLQIIRDLSAVSSSLVMFSGKMEP